MEIAAAGRSGGGYTQQKDIAEQGLKDDLETDIAVPMDLGSLQQKYGAKLNENYIVQRYNVFHSREGDEWGTAKETPEEQYQKWGVTPPVRAPEEDNEVLWEAKARVQREAAAEAERLKQAHNGLTEKDREKINQYIIGQGFTPYTDITYE